ncbi:65_t:CDS:2, partial [Funneliformis geosporum]
YLHSSRDAVQKDLRECLEVISHTAKAKNANLAKSYLANLDNMFKSKQAEDFWRKLEERQLNDDVKFSKEKHNKKLIVNVLREHDSVSSSLVVSETEGSSQQRCVSSNEDDLSNGDDLSDNGLSDDDDLPIDNNDDFSNGSNSGKDNEYENEDDVDVADLCKPHVMEADTGKVLTSDE